MRDVIIVGGGPAGSSVAKGLAKNGLDVLLLEKKQEIGVPKRCAEGVSVSSMKNLNIPERCIARDINGGIIYAPNGKRIHVDFEKSKGMVLERKVFDKWLAYEAARAGAQIKVKHHVLDLLEDNKGVKAKTLDGCKEIQSRMVVAADGVESLILRKAGIKSGKNPYLVDSGLQYEMGGLDLEDPDKIIIYVGNKIAPRGYVWIFPKADDVANVGIGIGGTEKKSAKYYLNKFIEKHNELKKGSIVEINSGGIPVGGLMKNMVGDNILGVGDAVNQVNPIHGGGIGVGMKAGMLASSVITKCIENGDTSKDCLKTYNKLWWKEEGMALKRIERVREVVEKLDDKQLNRLAEVLQGDDIVKIARGNKLKEFARIVAKFKIKGIKDLFRD